MSTRQSLATIMIPTYNQAGVVAEAVRSALAQTYQNLEIIVADDASTDGTADLIAQFLGDSRLRYSRNKQRLGRVGNYRRTLYEQACGKWVVNVDGDDYLTDPRFIEDAMAAVGEAEDVVIVAAGQRTLLSNGLYKDDRPTDAPVEVISGRQFFLRPLGTFAAAHLTTLYRRDLAMSLDFYRYDIASADRESLWRLALHGNVVLLGRVVGVWREHGGNTITNLSRNATIANAAAIVEPYRYALQTGVPRRELDWWRDRSLAAYVVTHAPFVSGGRFRDARAVFGVLRPYPRAYALAVGQVLLAPQSLARWAVLALAGERAFLKVRSWWQRLTWQSPHGSQ